MRFRVIAVAAFVVVLAAAVVFFGFEDKIRGMGKHRASASDIRQQLEEEYEKQWEEGEERVENRLTYQKQMAVIHVGELNSHLYLSRQYGDHEGYGVTLNSRTQSLYFTKEALIPDKKDQMLLIHDIHSMDTFIKQNIYKSGSPSIRFELKPVQQQVPDGPEYQNDYRLFGGQTMTVTQVTQGSPDAVQVEFDGQTKLLQSGEKAYYDTTQNKDGIQIRSKIVVTNFGLWDTLNMTYVVNP